jgi:hypothetical protein
MLYEKSNRKMTKIYKQISRSYLHNGKVATEDREEGEGTREKVRGTRV